ncbi:RluA family pseudouridine synthase [Vulgatibacter incomptus]|uniref:Pseudouridine synthase n=1 Tax=Vulgatibacter incomptus TaxID=1391653 RepID=A0A0K1PD21_9BACT|nr:RluA family pseudouridine synthase [Vulgatibacter incomptus]AKU91296.1 Ribosomal large subunit pseudouridine synthase D [Vulgatibacter incomptus]
MEILFEDDDLVAVDKPAGIPVIPGRNGGESLRDRLEAERGAKIWVVHRLDAGTSGALVFAKNAAAHRALSLAFEGREVEKRYLAIVEGEPAGDELRIDVPLHAARKGRMRPARPDEADAKPSVTDVRVLERLGSFSLVEARPLTGRQHQIRVHLKSIGHSLAVDPAYGSRERLELPGAKLERTPLHAARLSLPHPKGGRRLVVEAPLATDLTTFLDALRKPE